MKSKIVVCTLATIGLLASSSPAQEDAAAMRLKADQLVRQNQDAEAIALYKKANEMHAGKCPECLAGLASVLNKIGAHKPAAEAAQKLIDLNVSPEMNTSGYAEIGVSHMRRGNDGKALASAEAAFRKSLEISEGRNNDARFALGVILLRQKRDDDAIALLKEFLEKSPDNQNAARARQMLARPQCGREECAPEVSLVTLDGDHITLESFKGKITLLHFFTTTDAWQDDMWPGMKRLAAWTKKTGSPVQIIGVSTDVDEGRVRAYVQRRSITWPVCLNVRNKAGLDLQVTGYPYQIVVNHEGIIVHRRLNWSTDQTDVLNQVISIAVGDFKKAQKAGAKGKDEKKRD